MKVLSGPILRRVEATTACIWLIINGTFDKEQLSTNTSVQLQPISNTATTEYIKLTDQLHAILITLQAPQAGWPEGDYVHYDLLYQGDSLIQKQYFNGPLPTYPGHTLPCFRYFSKHQKILNASCRKPHGTKQDALAAFDKRVENRNKLDSLPDIAFFTGDQIYADDVDPQIAKYIFEQSQMLFNNEALAPAVDNNTSHWKPSLDELGWQNRQRLLNKQEGFYSQSADHHLLGFREYMLMYMLAWGGLCHDLAPPSNERPRRLNDIWKSYDKALSFVKQSWRVRRLLAHVPSYMMFDDHEVTDDWNLTKKITEQLSHHGHLGQQVVTHALAAFTICQAWGNSPTQHQTLINDLLPTLIGSLNNYDAPLYQNVFMQLNQHNFTTLIPSNPPALLIDTRTQRTFKNEKGLFPLLVDDPALATIKAQLATLDNNTKQLLVISPAPVFGFSELEQKQLGVVKTFRHGGSTFMDGECWISDEQQLAKLCEALMSLSHLQQCYILSGDVHYGFCRVKKIPHPANSHTVNFWQLTSSSISNKPTGAIETTLKILHSGTVLGLSINPFHKRNTQYLKPKKWQGKFLSGNLNLGFLMLDDANGHKYTMDVLKQKGQWKNWQYDLNAPDLLQ
ncbi:hypothetical protein PSECIP111854_01204 [Pseudoalteromonas sp. CIP111854]|uniref:PhoD-like phosphatase metallophosphatase domain-containing protein n=1 Tax=Pseudoalteromonas holothuriae TaxID=2963714 RepID=A0A9W4QUR1_9GAMM|nr:hypothetical protein [Pseudoalteromonas sp. CIP111854]CAH9053612.1 hypothetical protein PSECIP111854_01204 [Pseudoalteromonas sp. CIP111854]